MVLRKLLIAVSFILFSLWLSSFTLIGNKNIYGKWKFMKVHLEGEQEFPIKDLTAGEKELIKEVFEGLLNAFYENVSSIEFTKNKKYTLELMGRKKEGTWKQKKPDIIELYSENYKDTTILKILPNEQLMMLQPKEKSHILFQKENK